MDYVRSRELSMHELKKIPEMCSRHFLTQDLLHEYIISQNNTDRVISSQWLSEKQVIFGTRCNQLMIYNVETQNLDKIELDQYYLTRNRSTFYKCGIFLKINPSRTLLAAGARFTYQIVIYKLPSLDPVCIGESYKLQMYEMFWLDDEFLVSYSDNMRLALWRIDRDLIVDSSDNADVPINKYIKLIDVKECDPFSVRKIIYNKASKEIAALAWYNNCIRTWSSEPGRLFEQKRSIKLPELGLYAFFDMHDDGFYAIGSQFYSFFLDARLKTIEEVSGNNIFYRDFDVTSISFQGSILIMGTLEKLMFYDIRFQKYPKSSINCYKIGAINISPGSTYERRRDIELSSSLSKSYIYTHCYNPSGTKLFTAGGPLYAFGNYAGIWQ